MLQLKGICPFAPVPGAVQGVLVNGVAAPGNFALPVNMMGAQQQYIHGVPAVHGMQNVLAAGAVGGAQYGQGFPAAMFAQNVQVAHGVGGQGGPVTVGPHAHANPYVQQGIGGQVGGGGQAGGGYSRMVMNPQFRHQNGVANQPFYAAPLFHREYRLHGNISDDAEKSIKYNDLSKQIDDGRRKGHSEQDIMSGLRRGILVGSIKTYMDARGDMSLNDALEFLKPHLKELNPSELLNQLSRLTQKSGQTANVFLLEALKLRQSLMTGVEQNGVVYDARMAQSVFLHTLRTGFRNERIRSHMLPYLDPAIPYADSVLIQQLNRAVAEEEERLKKLAAEDADKKKGNVNLVAAADSSTILASLLAQINKTQETQVNSVSMDDPLAIVMKQLKENETQMLAMQADHKNQMKVVQEQISELMKLDPDPKKLSWKKMGCENCVRDKKSAFCTHCWKCGGDGHKSRDNRCPPSN